MSQLRALLLRYRLLATVLLAAAVILRIAVPPGFMPVRDHGRIMIAICTGNGPAEASLAIPRKHHQKPDHGGDGDAQHKPCVFSGMAAPLLGGADPALLIVALLFVMGAALAVPACLKISAPARLRPPLRAPPFGI